MKTNSILLNCFPSFNASKCIEAIIKSLVCASFSFCYPQHISALVQLFSTIQHAFTLLSTKPSNVQAVILPKRYTEHTSQSKPKLGRLLRWEEEKDERKHSFAQGNQLQTTP